MAGLTNAESQATLDSRFPTTGASDFVQYSTNGTTEFAGLVGTAIGATGWLSGGTVSETYRLTNRITTAGGRTDERSFTISIRER